jgi:lipopolysaccharide transport system permease protein
MQNYSSSPEELVYSLWRNRHLIKALTIRDVLGRYKGSYLGILWSFFNPLLMLGVYTFTFTTIFKSQWGSEIASHGQFALFLFIGLIFFNLFGESINRSAGIIVGNANYVKKIVFPLEIMPWVVIFSALFHAMISLAVWFIAYIILIGTPKATCLFLPLIIAPLIFLTAGLSLIIAALGVYMRDITQVVGVLVSALMFLTPIFYPITAIPEGYRSLFLINPLTFIIENIRKVLISGYFPDFYALFLMIAISLIILLIGFKVFQSSRRGFADVL